MSRSVECEDVVTLGPIKGCTISGEWVVGSTHLDKLPELEDSTRGAPLGLSA